VKAAKRKAIEDNIAKAKASENKLTQTIDEQGNLVGAETRLRARGCGRGQEQQGVEEVKERWRS
jgi:hypothetical protein